MLKDLIVIDSYPTTDICREVLKECIIRLKDKFDIALTTHYPVDMELQNMVDYYIFDSFNDIIDDGNNYFVWHKNDLFHAQIQHSKNYAYSAHSCILNAVNLLRRKYKYFYHVNGDTLISSKDIDKLEQLKELTLRAGKKSLFFREKLDKNDPTYLAVIDVKIFFSETKFFIENFNVINSKEEFIDYTAEFRHPYVLRLLESYYAERIDNWTSDDVYLVKSKLSDYFTNSEIDVLNSFNGTPEHRRDYEFYLLKEQTSNKIFFAYITANPNKNKPHVNVSINNEQFTISNTTYHFYKEVIVTQENILLTIDGVSNVYKVNDILQSTNSFISLY